MTQRTTFRKGGRIALYIIGILVLLVCAVIFFISIPLGKRVVKNQVQSYLTDKLKTKVEIGAVDYKLPTWVEIKNVYIEDQHKDTLIYGQQLTVDLDMFKLLRGNTDIKKILFKNILINVSRRDPDTAFNFQFVMDAFTGNKPTNVVNPDTAALKLTLDRLVFDNVGLRFNDDVAGNSFVTRIKNLDATLNKFQPDRLQFGIDNFYADSVSFFMNTIKGPVIDSSKLVFKDSINKEGYDLFITADKFNLREVNVTVDNKFNGLYYANDVKNLNLSEAVFDLHRSYASADLLLLDSSFVKFSSPKVISKTTTDTATVPWTFKVNQVSLNNNQLQYDDNEKPKVGGLDFAHLDAEGIKANIASFNYSVDSTTAIIQQLAFRDKGGFTLDSTHVNFLFTDTVLSARELYVRTPQTLIQNHIEIRYDSLAGMKKYPQNSTVNAALNNSTISFNDLYMLMPSLKTAFPPAQFANNSVHFNTELRGSLKQVYLPYLELRGLSGSTVSARGTLYNLSDAERFSYDLVILGARIRKSDLLKFIPPENHIAFTDLPAVLDFSGRLVGNKNDLVADINARGGGLAFQGRVGLKNMSDPLRIQYDVAMRSGTFGKSFIMGFIPAGSLPPNISIPDRITASGMIKGNKTNVTTDVKLNTSYGDVTMKGYLRNMQDPKSVVYDLFITTNAFDLGRFLTDTTLGIATLSATAKGQGFDYLTMRSAINADITQLVYNKYNYRNASINSDFNSGRINAVGNIKDSSLVMNFNGDIDVRGKYPNVNGFVRIDTAELKKLNFYDSTLNLSLTANIISKSLQPRNLDASAIVDSIRFTMNNQAFALDTINLTATSENGIDDINLTSDFASVNVNGAFDYDKIGDELIQYVDHFYNITNSATPAPGNQQLTVKGNVKEHPLLKGLIPGLEDYDDISFNGSYSSAITDSALNFNADIPYLAYTGSNIRNGNISIASRNERLNYAVTFDTLHYMANTFYGTRVNGSAANDSLSIAGITQDNNRRDWFGLNASIGIVENTYNFRLNDNLLLNYERWAVAPDNLISYSPQGILVNNFSMSSDTASISINSQRPVLNSPIDVVINNFNLKSISSILSKNDTLFLTGVMDAKLLVSDLEKKTPGFTGNAQISNLTFKNQPVGTVEFTANKEGASNIAATLDLTGNGNDIHAYGNYYLNNLQQQFDAEVDVNSLNIATLQGFTAGAITNASGNIHGNLTLSGKFANPQWNGQLNFDTTKFALAQFGTPYKINNQKIVMDYPDIIFDNFVVLDSLNNKMTVDGEISSNSLFNYDLNLDLNAVDFIVINARKAIDNQFYGFASVDAFVTIQGTSEVPEIEGDVFVNDISDLTIVLPEAGYTKQESRAIVRFVDLDTFQINPPPKLFEPENEPDVSFGRFLNYNLNIEVNKNAKLAIIIDPVTGDEIRVQGDAQLNAGVDPGGNIILAGTYSLDQGSYVLHYQFLERKFELMRGSTITFSGTPMDAMIDITAEYTANTSARDLLANEVGSVDPILANSFNQKIPFRVILYLTGILSKPDINFDIQLPDENTGIGSELRTTIDNKLTQIRGDQSATNKQVFSLLLLNRFVGEQSSDFFRGNDGGFNDLARQSVSQFLSGALNEIASDLFKGVDIDLNLNSYQDYRYGGSQQRTDLNVALSKSFLDDRLTVTLGTNIGIEGDDPVAKAGRSNSSFMPDITLGYKLTKDGRYMLRAYRRNQFEVVLDGYVIENGLGFVVTMDYDKFNELFRKRK